MTDSQSISVSPSRRSYDLYATKTEKNTRHCSAYIDWYWLRYQVLLLLFPKEEQAMIQESLVYQPLCDVRVVDVGQGCIVRLPKDARYIALSNIWVTDSADHFPTLCSKIDRLSLPGSLKKTNLPLMIMNAITVCKELECRYLWVDRFCIIQDEVDANSTQLKQMASLYHHAIFIIVAATGYSATYGLSGVNRARDKQEYIKLQGGLEIVESVPNLNTALSSSKWNERGWTYQEHVS